MKRSISPAKRASIGGTGLMAALLIVLSCTQSHSQSPQAQTATGMDQAVALLTEARLQFQNVRDYECQLIKKERVKGILLPQSMWTMKVRNKPFSVYLRCESSDDEKGLEVCYVAGRDHGMMRVQSTGLLCILGFVSVDP